MNIFLVGLGLSESMKVAGTKALRSATDVYPQLDLDTLSIWNDRNTFVGTLSTNPVVASPREYVAKSKECLTLFTGTPISFDEKIVPHRATDLAGNWNQLPKKLDGQFAAIRVDFQNLQIEVLTDPLGMEQVYVHQHGPTVLVSNSVRLIEQTCGLTDIDEIGASLFLLLGWVGGNRTLRESVQVLPGGYVHRWESNGSSTSFAYLPRTGLAQLSQRCDELRFDELAHTFVSMFRALSDSLGPLACPITGGRDSRVLVAAVIASGVPATFFTGGSAGSVDVQIGTKIAEALRLPYQVRNSKEAVTDCWDEGSRRLIRQNDGMVNLWQIANSIPQCQNVESLPLELWGVGGEIARGSYYRNLKLPPTLADSQMLRLFPSCLVREDTYLLKRKTRHLALQSVRETCQAFLDDGFKPQHVPDAFYTFERVRRWAGTNTRSFAPICDLFTPFCTRPYIETALAMPLPDRITGRIYPELIRATEPSLLDFPYDKLLSAQMPKRSTKQVIAHTVRETMPRWLLAILRYGTHQLRQNKSQGGKGSVKAEWVEAKREAILDVCLNQHSSVLWNYVDRRAFENIMSVRTAANVRRMYCARILSIATLFYYEAER